MLKNTKSKLIAISIITIIILAVFGYVNYLINKPLDIELPKQFIYNNKTIALNWTDDNTGEDLIIQSDKKEYNGFNSVDVYFSITNINKKDQDMDVVVWVGDEKVKVEKMEKLENAGDNENQKTTSKEMVLSASAGASAGLVNLNYSITDQKGLSRGGDNSYMDVEMPGIEPGRHGLTSPAPQPAIPTSGLSYHNSFASPNSNRKNINGFTTGYSANDKIESGKTNYYKATIKYPPMSNGEFFIEAFGKSNSKIQNSKFTQNSKFKIQNLSSYGHLDPWYSSNWSYRKRIDIEADQVLGNETDFPVLATTTDSDLAFTGHSGKVASSTGADIVFADAAGNLLNYEREKYASTTGEIVYWIKTDISSTTDKVIYMYYGNSGMTADLATTTGVWDDNFVMVQHMNEEWDTTFTDSTQYNNDGTHTNFYSATSSVDAQIDGGIDFDGTDDYIGIGNAYNGVKTISFWLKPDDATDRMILDIDGTDYIQINASSKIEPINFPATTIYVDGTVASSTDTNWHYAVITNTTGVNASAMDIGKVSTSYFDGTIDEVRVSNTARSSNWIKTEYNNQVDVDAFLTFGAEEDNVPTEFVSTICQNTGAGGDCADLDYSRLYDWEDAVECDLTATTTRVFSGTVTGSLSENNAVELYRGGVDIGIDGVVVATTSDQILLDGITGVSDDGLVVQSGDQWRYLDSDSNMFTVSGFGSQLGDSAIAIAKIDGAWSSADETAVTIDGWTTSASNYIRVYTTASARHGGGAGITNYRLNPSTGVAPFVVSESYTQIEGIEILDFGENGLGRVGISINVTYVTISYCLIHDDVAGNAGHGVFVAGGASGGGLNFYNNIIYNIERDGINVNTWGGILSYAYNNTIVNCSEDGFVGTELTLKNNIAQSCTTGFSGGFDSSSTHNLSDDATYASSTADTVNTHVLFADEANDDFHLAMGDTAARNQGTNLSKDSSLSFQDDIDGKARDASWDIGADEAKDVWYNTSYQCRRTITLQSSQIATTTSNFPVLATTTFANLKTSANGGKVRNNSGHDIVFINSDGSSLMNYEQEKYASTTGEIVYWIKTDISSTTDKTIYMYYGNSGASDLATTTGVWDDNFVGVWHLQETPAGTTYDSTSNNNDGTTQNMDSVDQVAGQIDGSLDFDGWSNDHVRIPNDATLQFGESSFSCTAWIYPHTTNLSRIINNRGIGLGGSYAGWQFKIGDNAGSWEFYDSSIDDALSNYKTNDGLGSSYAYNQWYQVVMLYDADNELRFYVNGALDSTVPVGTYGSITNSLPTAISAAISVDGSEGTYSQHFDGLIDEIRVSNTARTAGWISTEYNNQSDVSSFITYGAEECLSAPVERSGGESVKTRIKGGSVFKGGVRF